MPRELIPLKQLSFGAGILCQPHGSAAGAGIYPGGARTNPAPGLVPRPLAAERLLDEPDFNMSHAVLAALLLALRWLRQPAAENNSGRRRSFGGLDEKGFRHSGGDGF